MVKYYNGEMYIIPNEFEAEVRADERKKVLDEVINKISRMSNGTGWLATFDVIYTLEGMKGV